MKQEIIELQNETVNSLFNLAMQGKENITLKAPTGSGKTYMMASLMNKMLEIDDDFIFIVSTLSKGKLAGQNFESFANLSLNTFTRLNPFYISSGAENTKNTEYSLYIDINHNVFVLPTSQYT
ncbi:DEAD/DEAH box helicase family protein, partial [Campylobacter lari]